MLEFRAHRETGQTFPNRDEYLVTKTGDVPFERRLCHALAYVNEPLTRPPGMDLEEKGKTATEVEGSIGLARGFPWVTLVLGSGCYEPQDSSTRALIDGLPAAVAFALEHEQQLEDDTAPAALAASFTASLVKDRLGIATTPGAVAKLQVGRPAAELVYVTALLTRFFHQVKSLAVDAPSRWSDDVATLPANLQATDEILGAVVVPARKVLLSLLGAFPEANNDRVSGAIHQLLFRLRQDLETSDEHSPTLHAVHLRVVAECAWHILTLGTPVYPGWSDLLVDLSLYGRLLPSPNAGRPRPLFDSLADAPTLIETRYKRPTEVAWRARVAAARVRGEGTLHDRAAEVLRAQVSLRKGVPRALRPPVASAFVTTFDLEMEMALWAQEGAEEFLVAVPVYAYRGEAGDLNRTAVLCWVGAHIFPDHTLDPEEQLDSLLKPRKWVLLSGFKSYDTTYGQMPVVVRLSGCPTIALPDIGEGADQLDIAPLRELDPARERPVDSIGHAVLLDEYVALQHASVENATTHHPQSKLDRRYGLPPDITGVPHSPERYARFWTIMGVQMGDSGVRFRVASQIGSPSAAMGTVDTSRRPRRAGVVINQRLDVAEQDLLYWYGFDIVTSRCQVFASDLSHYVGHLNAPSRRTLPRTRCPLQ